MDKRQFEDNLKKFIEKHKLLAPAQRAAAAVSGGADSTALLYSLWSLKQQNFISSEIICIHINHQLRGFDSDTDEKFVIELASQLNIQVITKKINVRDYAKAHKLSMETAARNLRIEALCEIAKGNACSVIATGHQADDNAETVIHRLLRGTAFRGLCGIKPKNILENGITLVRPLLCFTRKQIADYLAAAGLSWRTDATNFDCRYKRNLIRRKILPCLQKQGNKSIVDLLSSLSQAAQNYQDSVHRLSLQLWPKIASSTEQSASLDVNKFSQLHPALKPELTYIALLSLGCPQRDLTQTHYEAILKLAQNCSGNKKIDLPCFYCARKEYGKLIFEKPPLQNHPVRQFWSQIPIDIPMKMQGGKLFIETQLLDAEQTNLVDFKNKKDNCIESFDFEKISPPIIIRKRKTGDKFHPLGLSAEKRVGKFLTDKKIPSEERQNILIVSDKKKIIWLWPLRICDDVKVTSQTKKILRMQIIKK